jgi:hypothetical protein
MSLTKTIAGMADLISSDIDLSPTIRPVLDLTDITDNAAKLDGILAGSNLSVGATYISAGEASAGYQSNRDGAPTPPGDGTSSSVTFVQNNTSPKALSAAEIYRQTSNQLSIAKKGVLNN